MTAFKSDKPAPKTVNLRTLAEYLELSQTTVSLVLNNSPAARSIPEHTRQRIREAARKLQYKPSYFARSLRSSRSLAIGVLAPDLSEGYFTLVMNGVQQELLRSHYFYFTACHYWQQEWLEEYPRLLKDRAVDGFLLLNTRIEAKAQVPVVAISSHVDLPGATNLVLDHEKAAQLALEYLYNLGHRSIAFVRGPAQIPDSGYRWQGIERAAAALGLPILPELTVTLEDASLSPEAGFQRTQKLLEKKHPFTAIFCFNDVTAIGAVRALEAAGKRVPDHVSVIGFDDILSAGYLRPSLTTVRQPLLEMGRQGARILLERIADPSKEFPAEISLEPELIQRESTGPAKG